MKPLNLITRMYHVFKHLTYSRSYLPCIVLTRSRTGSNMVVSLLNSHPNIVFLNEAFVRLSDKPYTDILKNVFSRQPSTVKVVGFKIFYYHPIDAPECGLWEDLMAMENLQVIHLKRRNYLRTLVSRKIAEKLDVWSTAEGDTGLTAEKRVDFSVAELTEGFEEIEKMENEGAARFESHKIKTLVYEDILSNRDEVFDDVWRFLGVRSITPATALRRQNPESLAELISNYQELKRAFRGTHWEHFFED